MGKSISFTIRLGLFLCLFFYGTWGLSQLDPSSSLLLNPQRQEENSLRLDSGRYEVRTPKKDQPSNPTPARPLPPKTTATGENQEGRPTTQHSPTPKISNDEKVSLPLPEDRKGIPDPVTSEAPKTNAPPPKQESKDMGFTDRVSDYLLGGEDARSYSDQLDEGDPRRNVVELDIAPALIYNDSSSNYWYRSYSNFSPAFSAAMKFWLSPFFGIHTHFLSSLSGDVVASTDGSIVSDMNHQWFDFGIRFRKIFGPSLRSPTLIFGIDYQEYQFNVPPTDMWRVRLQSNGVQLSMEALLPSKKGRFWILGLNFAPILTHSEIATGIALQSGSHPSSASLGIVVGKKYMFSRTHQIFWRLSHSIEKVHYSDSASLPDPITNTTPQGVSVTNGITFFKFGFQWGL